jgi:hypothetical protein
MKKATKNDDVWAHIVKTLRTKVYPQDSEKKAAEMFDALLLELPTRIANYLRKNKRGIILGKMTLAARRGVLTRPDSGEVDFPWTQGSESFHMVLRRHMPNLRAGKPGFLKFLKGLHRYFVTVLISLRAARSACVSPMNT